MYIGYIFLVGGLSSKAAVYLLHFKKTFQSYILTDAGRIFNALN